MNRRTWMTLMAVFTMAAAYDAPVKAEKYRLYIGTYTRGQSKGIYRLELDAEGNLSTPALAAESAEPSFLAIHPSGKFLYAVNEVGDFQGQKAGGVSAFAIDAATGNLTLLNQQSSGGGSPCHVVVDKLGKHVLIANYSGGSCGVLPIEANGRLAKLSSFQQHRGAGTNPRRQEAPHAHSINLDAENRFAFVADLGLDQVLVYRFDASNGMLTPHDPPFAKVAAGSGPRHFAFHPDGKSAYVINELTSTVTAFAYDAKQGRLQELGTVRTLPEGFMGNSSTAEVLVHPSGKFLYGSNRGHDSLAMFHIHPVSRNLTLIGHQGAGIKTPRNFAIVPDGKFVVVANQGGNSLVVFRVDPNTGKLDPIGSPVTVGSPVCIRMVAL